jgi:hypothetical protein
MYFMAVDPAADCNFLTGGHWYIVNISDRQLTEVFGQRLAVFYRRLVTKLYHPLTGGGG